MLLEKITPVSFLKEELIMVNNKYFMDFIRNEISKKTISDDNPFAEFVKFALTEFDDTSMRVCRAINSNDRDTAAKELADLELKMRIFISYAQAMKVICIDELFKYKAKIDGFAKNVLKKNFEEVA